MDAVWVCAIHTFFRHLILRVWCEHVC
jgi:hypothetical protein